VSDYIQNTYHVKYTSETAAIAYVAYRNVEPSVYTVTLSQYLDNIKMSGWIDLRIIAETVGTQ